MLFKATAFAIERDVMYTDRRLTWQGPYTLALRFLLL